MKNLAKLLVLVGTFLGCSIYCNDTEIAQQGIYKKELAAFKNSKPYQIIFDRSAHEVLRNIIKDIELSKELPADEHAALSVFAVSSNGVAVTRATMPKLYGYIVDLCKKHGVKQPTIFITRDECLFNAQTYKILKSSGGILIGQDLLNECTDTELEAIIAHEIGHLYHDHINKTNTIQQIIKIGIPAATGLLIGAGIYASQTSFKQLKFQDKFGVRLLALITMEISMLIGLISANSITQKIIGKKHEKEADQFAFAAGKSEGLIAFFEHMKQKDQKLEDDFAAVDKILSENESFMAPAQYRTLRFRYNQLRQAITKYYALCKTRSFPHPIHDERIEAAKEYQRLNPQ